MIWRELKSQNNCPSFFFLKRDSVFLDQSDKVLRGKARESGRAEARIAGDVVLRCGQEVGEIATSAARDCDLQADPSVVLEQCHPPSALPGRQRTHQTGAAAPDHNDVVMLQTVQFNRGQSRWDRRSPPSVRAYNRSSRVQAAGSSPALPLFEHAAPNVELEAPMSG